MTKYKLKCYVAQSDLWIATIELEFLPRKDDELILRSPEFGICQGVVSEVVIDTTEKEPFEIYLKDVEL